MLQPERPILGMKEAFIRQQQQQQQQQQQARLMCPENMKQLLFIVSEQKYHGEGHIFKA